MINVVACIVLNKKKEVLLQLRDKKRTISDPGTWTLPGGHVQNRESFLFAARRELLEETKLKPLNLKFISKIKISYNKQLILFKFNNNFNAKPICLEGKKLQYFNKKEVVKINTPEYFSSLLDLIFAESE